MYVRVLPVVAREIEVESQELKESIYGVLERLERGEIVPMPLCKPLPSIARGLYELRFSDRAGEYRVFYFVKVKEAVYVIHAMRKKSQKILGRIQDLLKTRVRSLL